LAIVLGLARVAYATALVAAPAPTTRGWLGPAGDTAGGRVATRGLGFRDGLISAGIAVAAVRDRPLRPWLAACVVSDLADIGATLGDTDGLPEHAGPATLAVAGGTALAGAALAFAADA
jgi:hypothetical protein